jgi:hypothetical protein
MLVLSSHLHLSLPSVVPLRLHGHRSARLSCLIHWCYRTTYYIILLRLSTSSTIINYMYFIRLLTDENDILMNPGDQMCLSPCSARWNHLRVLQRIFQPSWNQIISRAFVDHTLTYLESRPQVTSSKTKQNISSTLTLANRHVNKYVLPSRGLMGVASRPVGLLWNCFWTRRQRSSPFFIQTGLRHENTFI